MRGQAINGIFYKVSLPALQQLFVVVLNNPNKTSSKPSAAIMPTNGTMFVFALLTAAIVGPISTDIIVPVVPAIGEGLGISDSSAQLIIPLFLAGYAIAQIPFGLFADRVGRRNLLLGSLSLFCIVSILSVVSSNLTVLLCARFLLGIAAAGSAVLYRAIARDTHSGHELARIMSLFVSGISTVTLLSPMVGGLIASAMNWRAVFAVIALIGFTALVLSWLRIPETFSGPKIPSTPIDEAFKLFISSKQTIWATTMLFFVFFGFMSILGGFGTALANVYDQPVAKIGPLLSSVVVFFVASSMLSQRIVNRTGSMKLIKVSIGLFALSGVAFVTLLFTNATGLHYFLLAILPYTSGMGLLFPNAISIAITPQGQIAGLASSIIGTSQMLGAFLGSTMTAMLYQGDINNIAYPVIGATIALVLGYVFYRPTSAS